MTFAVEETAVIVVDMQNTYASPGGYLDLCGRSVPDSAAVTASIACVLDAARGEGMRIVYFQNGSEADYRDAGGSGSPNWHKSNAMREMRAKPELAGKLLARAAGTMHSSRASPRAGTIGSSRSRAMAALSAPGLRRCCAAREYGTSSSPALRPTSAWRAPSVKRFHREFFAILLEDAAQHSGPDYMQKATVFSVENFFGWVAMVSDFEKALIGIGQTKAA